MQKFVLTSQFDVMFHQLCNSSLTSTHHKKLGPGAYYMVVPNCCVKQVVCLEAAIFTVAVYQPQL